MAEFHVRYLQLAATDAERKLGAQLWGMFQEFRSLGDSLVQRRERQEAAFTRVAGNLARADATIDRLLHLTPNTAHTATKLAALSDLESELAEVAFGLANYQRAHDPKFKGFIAGNAAEFRATLARLSTLPLSPPEDRQIREVGRMFERTMTAVQEVLAIEDDLQRESAGFLELSAGMDDLLDERIQPLALEHLYQPRRVAGQAMASVLQRAHWLIPAVLRYPWPGNIRELRNVLERAILLGGSTRIELQDLRFDEGLAGLATPTDSGLTLLEVERRHIELVLREERGHVERAARRLGIPRSSLYQKIKQLGLRPSSAATEPPVDAPR